MKVSIEGTPMDIIVMDENKDITIIFVNIKSNNFHYTLRMAIAHRY